MAILLSRSAQRDIAEIRTYTIRQWSREKWLIYFADMTTAFDKISENPSIGRPQDALLEGMRSVTFQRHIIFYLPTHTRTERTAVLRVLHQRRNLAALRFAENPT
jgi:toxin ParE1/3/4